MTNKEEVLKKIKNLPTLPTVFARLSDAISNPSTSNEEIAKIIASDQAASFKILKVVNSAFYGFSGRIDTISRAILYLGLNEVRNLVFAISVINLFSKNNMGLHFRPVDFWSHSIAVGIITRMIGSEMKIQKLENYFLAGIMHDIGKLILFEYAQDEYQKVVTLAEEKKYFISDAEREVLGFDHSTIGELLSQKWNLPNTLTHAVKYHHVGYNAGSDNVLVAAVHIADIVSQFLNLGYTGDNYIAQPSSYALGYLNLSDTFFTDILDTVLQNYEETTKLLLT